MTERKFLNDYNIIVYAFALLIRQFQKENNIFAAQCVWRLASIIQYTEILRFYFECQAFPSEYVRDLVVTPLPDRPSKNIFIPTDNISELDLAEENIAEFSGRSFIEHPSRKKFLPKKSSSHSNQTRSGKTSKLQRIMQKTLAKRNPGKTDKQLQQIRESLRKDGLILSW